MKSLAQLFSDFRAAKAAHEKTMQDLPRIMGTIAVKNIRRNFQLQGYSSGTSLTPWVARKAATNKAYAAGRGKGQSGKFKGSVFNADNKILLQTRRLYNSIAYKLAGKSVFIGVDLGLVPYAKIHNEGGSAHHYAQGRTIHFGANNKFASKKNSTYSKNVEIGEHDNKMPKRQYMPLPGEGANKSMQDEIKAKFDSETKKNFKEFSK